MSTPPTELPLARLLAVSSELAEAATAGDWQRLGELQIDQARLVAEVFDHQAGQPLAPEMISTLRNVQAFTDLATDLADRQRERLVRESSQLQRQKTAASAYESCSTG